MSVRPVAISHALRLSRPAPISPAAPGLAPVPPRPAGSPRRTGPGSASGTSSSAARQRWPGWSRSRWPSSVSGPSCRRGSTGNTSCRWPTRRRCSTGSICPLRCWRSTGERTFRYESVYFDTPELTSYRLAAHAPPAPVQDPHTDVRRLGTVLSRGQDRGPPRRHGQEPAALPRWTGETVDPGRWFVGEVLCEHRRLGVARRPCVTRYRRTTFYRPDGRLPGHHRHRSGLAGRDPAAAWPCRELAIVETKTASAASPVDRLLWSAAATARRRISKYATGLAALRPELPDAPWRRTMRRHLDPATATCRTAPFPGRASIRRPAASPSPASTPVRTPDVSTRRNHHRGNAASPGRSRGRRARGARRGARRVRPAAPRSASPPSTGRTARPLAAGPAAAAALAANRGRATTSPPTTPGPSPRSWPSR